MTSTITIDSRFNGPPGSANGGYTSGLLAGFVGGDAEVSLSKPPPLGRALAVESRDGRAVLLDVDEPVAEASPTTLELEIPSPITWEAARRASRRYVFAQRHPFPTCFVCGPERPDGDGLRIFCGPVEGRELHAAPWIPATSLAGDDGMLRPEFVWASLDCPTATPLADAGSGAPVVLARLAVRIVAPVVAGEAHVLTSWPIAVDGRKRHAGSAISTSAGELCGFARALWIEVRPERD